MQERESQDLPFVVRDILLVKYRAPDSIFKRNRAQEQVVFLLESLTAVDHERKKNACII